MNTKQFFPEIKRTSKYFFELTFFSRKTVLRREQIHSICEEYLYSLTVTAALRRPYAEPSKLNFFSRHGPFGRSTRP